MQTSRMVCSAGIAAARFRASTTTPRLAFNSVLRQRCAAPTRSRLISTNVDVERTIYQGPLAKTFRYLKIFSLSSLALSSALSPFIFILESSLPMSGRIFLAFTAISTTTLSTWLISRFTSPYVVSISVPTTPSSHSHTLTTTSILLQPLQTRITSSAVLEPSDRPLTTWTLADKVDAEQGGVVAWTEDKNGWRGRWVVGKGGKCKEEGKMARFFNVHQELLRGSPDAPVVEGTLS